MTLTKKIENTLVLYTCYRGMGWWCKGKGSVTEGTVNHSSITLRQTPAVCF